MDNIRIREPLRAGLSRYDLDTGVCLIDAVDLMTATADLDAKIEFAHETAHWLTEALTSIGQLLVFLKGARDEQLMEGIVTNPAVKRLFQARAQQDDGQPLFPDWRRPKFSAVRKGTRTEHMLDYWVGNFRAETLIMRHKALPMDLGDRIALFAGAMEGYVQHLNGAKLLNNPSFKTGHADRFIENSLRRYLPFARAVEDSWVCETVDLMEAVAVCAELLWAQKQGNLPHFGETRLKALAQDTSYLLPIEHILASLGEILTAQTIVKHVKLILMVLECALNPPIPPIEECAFGEFDWSHVFPPMRFSKALWAISRPGALDGLSFDHAYEEEVDWAFQLKLSQAVDPPGRDFRVRIVETKDFDVFCDLPNRAPLQNMFVWVNRRRLLTPFSLRLWSANQFRLTAAGSGINTLTHALLVDDLRKVNRFCEPIVTLRSRDQGNDDQTLPVNSQLLAAPEVLEWFLVLTGAHYVIANFLVEDGPLDYFGFLPAGDFDDRPWAQELRRRTGTMFASVLCT